MEISMLQQIENLAWHINTNRNVLGDKKTLDMVYESLNNMIKEIKIFTK